MKTLVLNTKKWRCGFNEGNTATSLGKGDTLLLNNKNFCCCLGQFAPQLKKIPKAKLFDNGEPHQLNIEIPLLTYKDDFEDISNSKFSSEAISINDDLYTTIEQKLVALELMLLGEGYKLKAI